MDTLAVFRSRSDALKFYKAMSREKIACSTVSIPSYLRLGCGLAVVFAGYLRDRARRLIEILGITTFVGFYNR